MFPEVVLKFVLLAVVATGQPSYGVAAAGEGKSTAGASLLLAAADKADDRPLWVSVWGGATLLRKPFSTRAENAHRRHSKPWSANCVFIPSPMKMTPGRGCAADFGNCSSWLV